jgi:hypothetical protein
VIAITAVAGAAAMPRTIPVCALILEAAIMRKLRARTFALGDGFADVLD